MRRSDRPTKKQGERKNEAHDKLKDNSVTNTVTLDNYTMVEVLKHLNYCQLANNSLVSKRYRDVILKNRHNLALLKVDYIAMKFFANDTDYIKLFDTVLTPEAYKKWVVRHHYLRQIPLESQINEKQITQFYQLWACTNYKVYHPIVHAKYSNDLMTVFYANAELSREGWPSFLHFARLLTDPFIYIRDLELISQNVLNLLAEAIEPDQNGVKCDNLRLNLRDNSHAIFKWIKDYVLCNEFQIHTEFESVSNYDEEFLDLFMTGANCTSTISTGNFDLCDVVTVFVQKFMELKSGDENQLVESIRGNVLNRSVEGMKRNFAELIATEEEDHRSNTHIFDVPNAITLNDDTMFEVLKHLNYCQLASSSLVSKRYRDVIEKNRYTLALLRVSYIGMSILKNDNVPRASLINLFGEHLSPEACNEWVIRNQYLRQVPLESQFEQMRSTRFNLWAYAYYDPNRTTSEPVFDAYAEFSNENWSVFQHFVRLVTDPFIYIEALQLITQIDVLSLFAGAIEPDRNRLKCNCLHLVSDDNAQHLRDNKQEIITWMKDHVLCNELYIRDDNVSNYGEDLHNLAMTGANCTSKIVARDCDFFDVVVVFVQKFMDLKSCDENQLVESMRGGVMYQNVEGIKRYLAKFNAKEGEGRRSNAHILEFVNNDIGKKLLLTTEKINSNTHYLQRQYNFSIKISNV